jgi:hypothetical protein
MLGRRTHRVLATLSAITEQPVLGVLIDVF